MTLFNIQLHSPHSVLTYFLSHIHTGIPVSGALLETRPQKAHAFKGKTVLVCSVANGTGITTFFWYREDIEESLGRKSGRFQRAELETPAMSKSHSGSYYCTADNGYGPIHSVPVNVTISGEYWCPLTLFTL